MERGLKDELMVWMKKRKDQNRRRYEYQVSRLIWGYRAGHDIRASWGKDIIKSFFWRFLFYICKEAHDVIVPET